MTYEKILGRLKDKLSEKRYIHSMGVEYTAAALAMVWDVDVEKARLAGILHDCAKGLSGKDSLEKAKKHNIPISKYEKRNPELLHAKLGAYYAKAKYDIDDEEILAAIACHTTGKPGMNTLEEIIFVADYIEPNRKPLPEIEEIRKEAFTDLHFCVLHILKNTIAYLKKDGAEMDEMTEKTYAYYLSH